MSTPICDPLRRGALAGLVALLAACATSLPAPDRADVRVLGETVTIVAPQGLCVDPASLDVGRAGGFMLITDCAVIGEVAATGPGLPGVLTVSVTTGDLPGTLADLEAFVTGPGLLTLGKSGRPEAVSIRARSRTPEALFVKIRDTGPQPVPGAAPEFWRVFFDAGPRLVSASLTGFSDAALSDAQAQRVLSELVVRTLGANAVAAPAAASPVTGGAAPG
ncbi:hypothetical protein GE300_07320 [Rhodobacteraceae bacterium 2CG4]|uniref:Dihydroxy-acid dehydratase n=1 Tax=Halovulum marinum TaxID=2662447 RepID=A0A6L5Z0C0_9RHOB|nr:hypothetical protein [Halovulum marinum]MSU89424.1 hypothetical protein [Halovulum marinum]